MNPNYIPGKTYRDSIPIAGPSWVSRTLSKVKDNFNKFWGLWIAAGMVFCFFFILFYIVYSHNKDTMICHNYAISFLEKNNFKKIKTINHWDGNFQVGSGCLGKDYATNFTGDVNGQCVEATTCCSKDADCKCLKYVKE